MTSAVGGWLLAVGGWKLKAGGYMTVRRERARASEPGERSGAEGPPRASQWGSPRGEAPRPGLERFVRAQDEGGQFDEALREISAGRKRGHWIWFVFPQVAGLGTSSMSRMYAIRDRDEADAYLQHPVLFPRLLTITSAAAEQVRKGVPIETLMGSPIDATKLVSSMTLFRGVATRLHQATGDERFDAFARLGGEILAAGSRQGYPPCQESLAIERERD